MLWAQHFWCVALSLGLGSQPGCLHLRFLGWHWGFSETIGGRCLAWGLALGPGLHRPALLTAIFINDSRHVKHKEDRARACRSGALSEPCSHRWRGMAPCGCAGRVKQSRYLQDPSDSIPCLPPAVAPAGGWDPRLLGPRGWAPSVGEARSTKGGCLQVQGPVLEGPQGPLGKAPSQVVQPHCNTRWPPRPCIHVPQRQASHSFLRVPVSS